MADRNDVQLKQDLDAAIYTNGQRKIKASDVNPVLTSFIDSKQQKIRSYTTAQIAALSGMLTGQIVYDSTLNIYKYYNGTIWVSLSSTISGTDKRIMFFDGANNPAGVATLTYDKANDIFLMTNAGADTLFKIDGSNQTVVISDPNSLSTITIDGLSADRIKLNTNGGGNIVLDSDLGNIVFDGNLVVAEKAINTSAGDSATINAATGRFRKDTTGTAFTLTNSYITANSIIILTAANAAIDATATSWTVSAGSGSATITFNAAPTSNFDMNFWVVN